MTGVHAPQHAQTAPFWQKTSAIIVAIGTMVISLLGLAAFMVSQKWFGPSPEDIYTPPGGNPVVLDRAVLWGPTEIRVEPNMQVDFDLAAGPKREMGQGTDLFMWAGSEVSSPFGVFVWADKTRAPSMRDCVSSLDAQGKTDYVPVSDGMQLCVGTNEGRVAMVMVKRRDGEAWLIDGTVWKQRIS
ncbi:MAG TPA: hypothetical protein VF062_09095 [Candidatus Limnocylindrales bacterium]